MKYGFWLLTAAGMAGLYFGLKAYNRNHPREETPATPDNFPNEHYGGPIEQIERP